MATGLLCSAVLAAQLLLTSCAQSRTEPQVPPIRGSEDNIVIQAAMLAFFEESRWNQGEWSKGDFVVLKPDLLSHKRPNFQSELASRISRLSNWSEEEKSLYRQKYEESLQDAAKLREIADSASSEATSFEPGKVLELATMSFDSRIVVSDFKYKGRSPSGQEVKNKDGKTGTLRALVSIHPPGYSKSGKLAVLVGSLSWSVHSAQLKFFLKRGSKGWKVVSVGVDIFP